MLSVHCSRALTTQSGKSCTGAPPFGARSRLSDSEWRRRKGRRHHFRPADGVPIGGTRPKCFQTAAGANAAADPALHRKDSAATLDNGRTEGSRRPFVRQVQRPPASGGETAAPVSPRSRLRSLSQRFSSVGLFSVQQKIRPLSFIKVTVRVQ